MQDQTTTCCSSSTANLQTHELACPRENDNAAATIVTTGPSSGCCCSSGYEGEGGGQKQHAAATSPNSSRVSFAFNPLALNKDTPAQQDKLAVAVAPTPAPATRCSSSLALDIISGLRHHKLRCLKNKTTSPAAESTFSISDQKPFQVHSRHQSIWQLDELTINERPIKTTDSAIVVKESSSSSQQKVLSRSIKTTSSFGNQYKPQTLSQIYNLSNSQQPKVVDRGNEQMLIASSSLSNIARCGNQETKSKQEEISTIAGENQASQEITMSQTLQSIHSLSMQLNRAASLSGSTHLDDLIDSAGAQSPHGCLGDAAQSTGANAAGVHELGQPSKLTRLVGKKATRVKEIFLQNLGKADKTTDELFKIYEENFYKQQAQASKLQKEFKTYVQSLKGAHDAGKSLNDFIQQSTGDYQSARHDLICENLSQLEHLNEDLMEKLRGQVLISVSEYLTQFKELRAKIAKRRRKLIDFDSSRRVYELALAAVNKKRIHQQQQQNSQTNLHQAHSRAPFRSSFFLSPSAAAAAGGNNASDNSIQSATSQLVDEARLLKLREQYNYCKIMYETINGELHEELPMVYEKKMKNLLMTLQNYFSLEAQYHSNAGKLFATSSDVIDDDLPMSSLRDQHSNHNHNRLHNHHHHHHHHHLDHDSDQRQVTQHHHLAADGQTEDYATDEANSVNKAASSSSGMGSSGADSSLDSDGNSETHSGSPMGDSPEIVDVVGGDKLHVESGDDDDDDDKAAAGPEQAEAGELDAVVDDAVEKVDVYNEQVDSGKEMAEDTGPEEQALGEAALDSCAIIVPVVAAASGDDAINAELSDAIELIDEKVDAQKQDEGAIGIELDGERSANTVAETGAEQGDKVEDKQTEQMTVLRCLHKVKTNYKYLAEDVDELCFEADEIIQVVEFDAGQGQEEGWLMGVREVNGQRGLFPANFTRPLE